MKLNSASPISVIDNPVDQLTYEQAFDELDDLISELESGEHPLDVSINLFERGQILAQHCSKLLEQADLKVQQLLGEALVDFKQ
jgi:exodeoxyribonuclease VII small subunit